MNQEVCRCRPCRHGRCFLSAGAAAGGRSLGGGQYNRKCPRRGPLAGCAAPPAK
ncbi:hypothetical protein HRUBRA_00016 [Pseudohaliea rubra DSM 19751]|uniref:Uncharacterized protein n=1 Tax=Pseudohaliea rubra DSM 19751 TaxID=1265313 RepID=A0A095XZX5_9GAMM|nr:hypothetical protein HRUBRA_00016 [Pseudohaliea rubra DSM 19751]